MPDINRSTYDSISLEEALQRIGHFEGNQFFTKPNALSPQYELRLPMGTPAPSSIKYAYDQIRTYNINAMEEWIDFIDEITKDNIARFTLTANEGAKEFLYHCIQECISVRSLFKEVLHQELESLDASTLEEKIQQRESEITLLRVDKYEQKLKHPIKTLFDRLNFDSINREISRLIDRIDRIKNILSLRKNSAEILMNSLSTQRQK